MSWSIRDWKVIWSKSVNPATNGCRDLESRRVFFCTNRAKFPNEGNNYFSVGKKAKPKQLAV